jgi:CheY-like chemotaxis protein
MGEHKFSIMIVDDVEDNRVLLETILEDDYNLSMAASGQECLDQLAEKQPDLILLDITMPDMDGLEACRRIVESKAVPGVAIIFVSALTTPEERLAGFEAGGDEYVTKPVSDEELIDKIAKALEIHNRSREFSESADNAMNIAMEAMVSSSELGMLNQFMRDSAKASSYQELGAALLEVTSQFGVNCCVQFWGDDHIINIDCLDGSLEDKLLRKFHGSSDKFVDFGARTVVNCNNAALLIKNMPVDDEAKYGRMRDHMSVLIDAVDSKVISLKISLDLKKQRDRMISTLIENNDEQLMENQSLVAERDESTRSIMKDVIHGVEAALFSLGLEEDQETCPISMLENGVNKVEALPDFGPEIQAKFVSAKDNLINLLGD